jgi:hypothetical protein
MQGVPSFPDFKPVELQDRDFINGSLRDYRPQTSEWTFTNLFMWRQHYRFHWSTHLDWLLVIGYSDGAGPYGLPPIGPASRLAVTRLLLEWLARENNAAAHIERADRRLAEELEGAADLLVESTREQFDYIYRSDHLIGLGGRKYHSKRNHINKFVRSYVFSYQPFSSSHVQPCLELAESWCQWRRCEEDFALAGEWDAIREALTHYGELQFQGGVIIVHNRLAAFALGEMLNDDTAVIHIEKADPEIAGIYSTINQQFCENTWRHIPYINREQDLGDEGLRKAKLSYYPDHFEEKYRVTLRG